MPKGNFPLYSLNGGEVGEEALARLDLQRMQFAASECTNAIPRIVGSLTLRPGLEYMSELPATAGKTLGYNYSLAGDFLPVFSDQSFRILRNGAYIERSAVGTTIANGDFAGGVSFTDWIDTSAGSAAAEFDTGSLKLRGSVFESASVNQTIPVAVADRGTEHGLRIDVRLGPVEVSLGSAAGGNDLIPSFLLEDGSHSLSFTPTTANVHLKLRGDARGVVLVNSVMIEAAGVTTKL